MSEFLVTNKLWQFVMNDNSSNDELPKVGINWLEAKEFCNTLMKMVKDQIPKNSILSLPLRKHWMIASEISVLQHESEFAEQAWYRSNSSNMLKPVGHKKANRFGLFDMLGNTYEYCDDNFIDNGIVQDDLKNFVSCAYNSPFDLDELRNYVNYIDLYARSNNLGFRFEIRTSD